MDKLVWYVTNYKDICNEMHCKNNMFLNEIVITKYDKNCFKMNGVQLPRNYSRQTLFLNIIGKIVFQFQKCTKKSCRQITKEKHEIVVQVLV